MKNNKGFTIIEILLVIVIIGILVSMAYPKFINYIDKAKLTQIKNDIKVISNNMDELLIKNDNRFPKEWDNVSKNNLSEILNNKKIYSIQGIINNLENDKFKIIPKDYLNNNIKSKLDGTFITDNKGYVYYTTEKNIEVNNEDIFDETDQNIIIDNKYLDVLNYNIPNGIYETDDLISGNLKLKGLQNNNYKIIFILEHVKTGNIITYENNFNLNKDELKYIDFEYKPKITDRIGFYNIKLKILNNENSVIFNYNLDKTIYIANTSWEYFYNDDFNSINKEVIGKIGSLNENNVRYEYFYDETKQIDYSKIDININANDNKTGQIKTKLPMTYGTYESKFKVPNSDSLLNGFFLYGDLKNNEIANEIDIEIYKENEKWKVMTTIYNPINKNYTYNPTWDPGVVHHYEKELDFDPSLDYHNYRIDFYKNYISFKIDDVEFDRWNGIFEYSNMYLYSGTFYTFWLNNNLSSENIQMNIEWIRRTFKE